MKVCEARKLGQVYFGERAETQRLRCARTEQLCGQKYTTGRRSTCSRNQRVSVTSGTMTLLAVFGVSVTPYTIPLPPGSSNRRRPYTAPLLPRAPRHLGSLPQPSAVNAAFQNLQSRRSGLSLPVDHQKRRNAATRRFNALDHQMYVCMYLEHGRRMTAGEGGET